MKTCLSLPLLVLVSILNILAGIPAKALETPTFARSNEHKLLGSRNEGRLIPLDHQQNIGDEPLILVHGRSGSMKNFTSLINSTPKLAQYKLYYFAFDDLHRSLEITAQDLALNLMKLRTPRITILAHSMGGIIARETLNFLAQTQSSENPPEIRVISIDTPWAGGTTAGCGSKGSKVDNMIERFMPAALSDMRSCSDFFQKIYSVTWPQKFSIELYFAEQGSQALDYSEAPLNQLPQKIVDLFTNNEPIVGSLYEMNFWSALSTARQYPVFIRNLAAIHERSKITAYHVKFLLEKYYPRFPGNHSSVLSPHPETAMDLPTYLQKIL